MAARYTLNFLLTEGPGGWSARCLEHNFVTQADTLEELYFEINRTVVGHLIISAEVVHREPFEGLLPAPREYWEQFDESKLSVRSRFTTEVVTTSRALPTHELGELRLATAAAS